MEQRNALQLRPSAETRFADELAALKAADQGRRPPGWTLSARAVRSFILGDSKLSVRRKFYGDDALVERALVALMSEQGLMLVGEPGTAKSMLSELLAAAISGDPRCWWCRDRPAPPKTISATAGTMRCCSPRGRACARSYPRPVHRSDAAGHVVRFEESRAARRRCRTSLISRPVGKGAGGPRTGRERQRLRRPGFNVIATANLRDRGVHEMSSALKRRFNFETVLPLSDPALEMELIRQEVDKRLVQADIAVNFPDEVTDLLVTTFQDLRRGQTKDQVPLSKPSSRDVDGGGRERRACGGAGGCLPRQW